MKKINILQDQLQKLHKDQSDWPEWLRLSSGANAGKLERYYQLKAELVATELELSKMGINI